MPRPHWCNSVHPGTSIYVFKGDTVLVLRRTGEHGSGQWAVPGGWIDKGEEDLAQAAVRELIEECGSLEVSKPELKGLTNDIFPGSVHSLTLHFFCEWINGEPKNMEPEKADEVRWMPWTELIKMPDDMKFLPIVNLLSLDKVPVS